MVYNMKKVQLLIFLVIFVQKVFLPCLSLSSAQLRDRRCLEKCGEVDIPYPFGTKEGCYLNSHFVMNCTSNDSGLPFLLLRKSVDVEVISISPKGQLRVFTKAGKDCYYPNGNRTREYGNTAGINLLSFPISNTHNKFTAVGCDTLAIIRTSYTATGCLSLCNGIQTLEDITFDGTCSGLGCCQTTIPKNLLQYDLDVRSSLRNYTGVADSSRCSYFFVAESNFFNFTRVDLKNIKSRTHVPTVLDWAIGNITCGNITEHHADNACGENSHCVDATNGPGYRCNCSEGYQGNPYLTDGCQDINECATTPNPCGDNHCKNSIGNYTCICHDGYEGDAKKGGGGCQKKLKTWIEITVGIAVGLAAFFIVGLWSFWVYSKRKHMLHKQKFFEQNGGLMLQKELSGKEGYNETAKIFTANELKEATNNFDESRIIGKGGFGTVYKGILKDGKFIAIKKSKVMDQDQIQQFINEIIVLSQINHRNVVRLLGCCLETEVPLLVYEYVSNGTLHEHIHENKNSSGVLSWDHRLRIATEIAGVLAYLHLEAPVSIVHRDIKCTNILLDDNHTAKVSDFGASRLVPIDQDMLATMVQGTIGYLDPEYLHTSQLTEKSDVYSFGVVLIELMTGKKALAFDRPEEERCLASLFIKSMNNDKLFSVVEDGLANEDNITQIEEVAKLALACIRVTGDDRPSMRQVASELQTLSSVGKHPWNEDTSIPNENDHLLSLNMAEEQYNTVSSHSAIQPLAMRIP